MAAAHQHQHASSTFGRAFALGVGLNLIFVIIEFIYGQLSHSLALVADAGHNLSDVLGLLLAWGATALAQRRPSPRRTYGWRRTSILAALLNAALLLVAVGGIGWEAVQRFGAPGPVAGLTVMVVAGIGVVINTITALLFMRGRSHDLNIRGAFLHMAADAGVSLGVVFAGLGMRLTGWLWLDPLVSLLVAGVILLSTWGLLRDSVNLALDAVPAAIDTLAVAKYLGQLAGVNDVHDLHIWAMSTTETALTAHVIVNDPQRPHDELLLEAQHGLHERFGIEHMTLQIETSQIDAACRADSGALQAG